LGHETVGFVTVTLDCAIMSRMETEHWHRITRDSSTGKMIRPQAASFCHKYLFIYC